MKAGGGAAAAMAARFDAMNKVAAEEDRSNPFSKNFDGGQKLKKGDAGYGRAKAGSVTEARAAKAQEWVETEIIKLLAVIKQHGETDSSGKVTITFGKLFDTYADISDTLVGILMRARRRKQLTYAGDGMLFQGVHDAVIIEVLTAS